MKNPLSGVDTSKKHGTNNNFMKSGMKNADGTASSGAPFLGGIGRKLMDPLGLFGKGKGKGGACPSPAQQAPAPRPAEPTGTPAPAAAAPAPAAPAAEEAQPAATMKKGLMKGSAPMKEKFKVEGKGKAGDGKKKISKTEKSVEDRMPGKVPGSDDEFTFLPPGTKVKKDAKRDRKAAGGNAKKKGAPNMKTGSYNQKFEKAGAPKVKGDKRKWYKKAWDKATQIGEGLKEGLYADSDYRGGGTNIIDSFKKGYRREKKRDEAAAKKN